MPPPTPGGGPVGSVLRAWERQSNFSGGLRRPEAGRGSQPPVLPAPGPAPPLARYRARLSGLERTLPRRTPRSGGASETSRSCGAHLAGPRCPRAALLARAPRPPVAGPFWVLGGYFPSGPTSLPVKESEVGAGPPLYPPPPASSCHLREHPRPTPRGRLAGASSRAAPCPAAPAAGFSCEPREGSRTLHVAYIRSPLPFPAKCETLESCFRQTSPGSVSCKVWFGYSCQIASPQSHVLKVFFRALGRCRHGSSQGCCAAAKSAPPRVPEAQCAPAAVLPRPAP